MDVLSGEEEKHQAPTLSLGPFMRLCVTSLLYTVPQFITHMLMDALASMQPLTSAVLRTHTHTSFLKDNQNGNLLLPTIPNIEKTYLFH